MIITPSSSLYGYSTPFHKVSMHHNKVHVPGTASKFEIERIQNTRKVF